MLAAKATAGALLGVVLLVACGNTSNHKAAQAGSAVSYLASQTGESAAVLQRALDRLAPSCREPEDSLAAYAYTGVQDLADHGITMTAVGVMNQMRASIPAAASPMSCSEVLAAWLVLREQ